MLAQRIASGAIWLVAARLATRTLDLVSMMVVARLLVPADFGLFALAASVLLVLNAVTDLSLSNAIVQMRDPPPSVYDTAFTLSLLRGCALALALVAVAYPFAAFYGDERLQAILVVLAGAPLLRSLVSPRLAQLQRELNFRPQFHLEAAGKVAAFLASVAIAWALRSYWALVAGMVAAPAISTVLSYRFAPYRPRLGLADWKPIFAFSGWLTLSNTVNTLNWQADRFFIGSRLGTATLGQYTVGSELASLPTNAPILPIMQALYAGFAKLSHDIGRLRSAYLMSQGTVIAIALPIAVSVAVFARPIIHLAIGPEWAPSAFVIEVLAPVFALQMLTAPAQSIAMATGRTGEIFRRDVVSLCVRLPLIVLGMLAGGLAGVVWARVASGLFIIVLNLQLMKRVLGVGLIEQLAATWRSIVSAAALAGFLLAISRRFDLAAAAELRDVPLLVASLAAGAVLYLALHLLLWAASRPAVSAEGKLLDVARRMLARRSTLSREPAE